MVKAAQRLIEGVNVAVTEIANIVAQALPTGASTEATLTSVKTAVELIDNAISGSELQVDVVSSALPTDAATQTTLALVKAKTDNIPALGQALAAASVPVILPAATITTLTPPAAITGFALETTQLLQPLAATTPVIYNVTMTLANTEYSQALPANTKKIKFRCQNVGYDLRIAYEMGRVATPTAPWSLLAAGEVEVEDGLNLTSKTIYFACSTAAMVFEITCWT